jgi:hypothetical protein
MPHGPVEYLVVSFPRPGMTGEVAPALAELVDSGTIRMLDLTFVRRRDDGTVEHLELSELEPEEARPFAAVEGRILGVLNRADVNNLARRIEPGSSAALVVWENLWATRLRAEMRRRGGRVVAQERIQDDIAAAALAAAEGAD